MSAEQTELLPAEIQAMVQRAKVLADNDASLIRSLIQVRKDKGLSQSDIADRMGITQPAIAAFERYDNDPKLSTVRRYAHAVGALITHTVAADEGQLRDHRKDGWMVVGPMAPQDAAVIGPLRIPLQLGEATSSFVMNPDMAAANAKVEFIQAA